MISITWSLEHRVQPGRPVTPATLSAAADGIALMNWEARNPNRSRRPANNPSHGPEGLQEERRKSRS